jgi:hypothetical protein
LKVGIKLELSNCIVPTKQEYQERKWLFDPDSSPIAWSYYEKLHTLGQLPILDYFEIDKLKHSYGDYVRLIATTNNTIEESLKGIEIAGDTDFNFNEKKYAKLWKILLKSNAKDIDFDDLDYCKSMHYNILNFSLMLRTGALNNFKGNRPDKLDRFDQFIYQLSQYFDKDNKEVSDIAKYTFPIRAENNKILRNEFLDKFDSVYDYCKEIYLLTDREFIAELILNGEKEIKNADDVRTYMNLAIKYWDTKKKYIENL